MMADDTEHQNRTNGAEASPETAQASVQTAGADAEALAAAIAERDEFKDRLLRTLAEMENLRRRTEREVTDARTYAVTNFAATCSTPPTISAALWKACRPRPARAPTARSRA